MATGRKLSHFVLPGVGLLILALALTTMAQTVEQQGLVDKARITIESFSADPELTWFRGHVRDAKGLLIVPQLLKGAFFVGGSGGRGVLLARDDKTGEWSQPAFYTLGGASIGFQFGGEASEVVLMVMSRRGIEALYGSSFKLGGDVSIAVGPKGAGVEGATAPNLSVDYLSWMRTKGAFAGFSLEGTIIKTNHDWNRLYYGKPVTPVDILLARTVHNPHSAGLRAAVARITRPVPRPTSRGKGTYHLVRRGETLYLISREYGVSVDELRRLNNLGQDHAIYPGQKLLLSADR